MWVITLTRASERASERGAVFRFREERKSWIPYKVGKLRRYEDRTVTRPLFSILRSFSSFSFFSNAYIREELRIRFRFRTRVKSMKINFEDRVNFDISNQILNFDFWKERENERKKWDRYFDLKDIKSMKINLKSSELDI